jgi:predicted membrane channel-forming protein YqfA (hemolysin III family)
LSELWKQESNTHTVRPRWTWIALVVMVAGLVLIGIGIVVPSWTWAIVGLVLLVAGGVAGLYGGFFYDVQGGGPVGQIKDAVEGKEAEFPAAGTTRSEAEVKEDVHRRWLSEDE